MKKIIALSTLLLCSGSWVVAGDGTAALEVAAEGAHQNTGSDLETVAGKPSMFSMKNAKAAGYQVATVAGRLGLTFCGIMVKESAPAYVSYPLEAAGLVFMVHQVKTDSKTKKEKVVSLGKDAAVVALLHATSPQFQVGMSPLHTVEGFFIGKSMYAAAVGLKTLASQKANQSSSTVK